MDITTTMDPELRAAFEQLPPVVSRDRTDFVTVRQTVDEMFTSLAAGLPRNEHVSIEERVISGPQDAPELPVRNTGTAIT